MAQYFSVITRLGAALDAASKADGTPLEFSHIAVGDGGGSAVTPSAERTALINEKWRGECNDLRVDPDNKDTWIAESVIPDDVGGWTIRELGLFTSDGTLFLYASLPATDKPLLAEGAGKSVLIRLPVKTSAAANVTLLIDPSKVLATRTYVKVEILALQETIASALDRKADKLVAIIPRAPLTGGGELSGDVSIGISGGAYELGEFYYFRHPTLRPGFQPAQGGLLANAAELYPDIWAYLQTTEGQLLCKTESEWQAMTTAIWATLADGSTVGWNGIGGAPYYAPNLSTGALRLPDLRGMYAEAAGYDALSVGGVHGDMIRNITGSFASSNSGALGLFDKGAGAVNTPPGANYPAVSVTPGVGGNYVSIVASRVVPTGNKVAPRAWGALPCAYLGRPAS